MGRLGHTLLQCLGLTVHLHACWQSLTQSKFLLPCIRSTPPFPPLCCTHNVSAIARIPHFPEGGPPPWWNGGEVAPISLVIWVWGVPISRGYPYRTYTGPLALPIASSCWTSSHCLIYIMWIFSELHYITFMVVFFYFGRICWVIWCQQKIGSVGSVEQELHDSWHVNLPVAASLARILLTCFLIISSRPWALFNWQLQGLKSSLWSDDTSTATKESNATIIAFCSTIMISFCDKN